MSEVFFNESNEAFFIPVLGSHKIKIGDLNNLDFKIKKMMTFYDKIIPKHGWEKYSDINLEYQKNFLHLNSNLKLSFVHYFYRVYKNQILYLSLF